MPADREKVRRPPNSWILFRSDVAAMMALEGKNHQSELSTTIATMWKNAPPHIKAEYEHRAEVKKLEHIAAHPGYRFMPRSKEMKAREKEEKKAKAEEKKRTGGRQPTQNRRRSGGAVAQANATLPSIPYPFPMPPLNPRWNPAGPSPPISAASSPCPDDSGNESSIQSSSASPDHASGNGGPIATTSNSFSERVRPYYRDYSHSPQTLAPQPSVTQQSLPQQGNSSHYRTPSASSQHSQHENNLGHQQQLQQYPDVTVQGYLAQSLSQQQVQLQMDSLTQVNGISTALNDQSTFDPLMQFNPLSHLNGMNTLDGHFDTSMFNFDMANSVDQNLAMWGSLGFQPLMDQLPNASVANCFQVQANAGDGPLEVEYNQHNLFGINPIPTLPYSMIPVLGNQSLSDFGPQTYFSGHVDEASQGNMGYMAGPSSHLYDPTQLAGPSSSSGTPDQSFQSFDEIINYNDTYDITQSALAVETQTSSQPTSYVPPSGAAYSGNRRVAGSWPATFALTEPIDV